MKFITFRTPSFLARFSSNDLSSFKSYLDTTLENVIPEAHLVGVRKETKVNV